MASPGRQKSECEFCLFGGGVCARRAALCAGLAVFARLAAVMRAFAPGACLPAVRFVRAFFSYLLPFSVWLLPLNLLFICRSCRDGHPIFFSERKWGKRTARGAARRSPSNPIPAPCGQSPLSPRCWPAYAAFGRKPPADGETLEKPGSRAQLFKRFCAKGDACALSLISPFLSLLAGLAALRAANRRQIKETPEKPRSKAQLFRRFCASGTRRGFCPGGFLPAAGNRRWDFSLPEETGAQRGPTPGKNRGRARRGEEKDTVRDLPGAAARLAHRRCARRRRGLSPRQGKQEPCVSTHPERTACVRGWAKKQTRSVTCPPQARGRARHGEEKDTERDLLGAAARLAHRRCRSRARATRPETTAGVRDTGTKQTRGAICSPQVCSAQPRVHLAFAWRNMVC